MITTLRRARFDMLDGFGPERILPGVLTAVCLTLAFAMVADTLSTIVRLHSALPYFDEWDDLDLFRSILTSATPLADLFTQHNEHRIFFPRLILYSDLLFFGGRGILDRIAIFAIQAGHAALMIGLLRACCLARVGRPALAAVIVMLFFSLRQEENFSWSFQVQFVGVFAAASLAIVLFARALHRLGTARPAWPWFVAAYGLSGVATFTMANGLLSAVVLVVVGLADRAPLRVILVSLAVAALLAAAYLYGYEAQPAHTPLSFSLRHPARVLIYTAVYLGNFLDPAILGARDLGLWGLAFVVLAAVRILVARDRHPGRLALFGIMLFILGTALITALGRVGFGLDQALSSRYSTGTATFWAAALIYGWSIASEWHRRDRDVVRRPVPNLRQHALALPRWIVGLTALVLVFGAIQAQGAMKYGMNERAYGQALSTDALLMGLGDSMALGTIDDNDGLVRDLSLLLKRRALSIFREGDARLVGGPVSAAGTLLGVSACRGAFDLAAPAPDMGSNGVRVSGRGWALGHRTLTGQVYIVDGAGTITGLASRQPYDQDPSAWKGVAIAAAGQPLRAIGRLRHGEICVLGQREVGP